MGRESWVRHANRPFGDGREESVRETQEVRRRRRRRKGRGSEEERRRGGEEERRRGGCLYDAAIHSNLGLRKAKEEREKEQALGERRKRRIGNSTGASETGRVRSPVTIMMMMMI